MPLRKGKLTYRIDQTEEYEKALGMGVDFTDRDTAIASQIANGYTNAEMGTAFDVLREAKKLENVTILPPTNVLLNSGERQHWAEATKIKKRMMMLANGKEVEVRATVSDHREDGDKKGHGYKLVKSDSPGAIEGAQVYIERFVKGLLTMQLRIIAGKPAALRATLKSLTSFLDEMKEALL